MHSRGVQYRCFDCDRAELSITAVIVPTRRTTDIHPVLRSHACWEANATISSQRRYEITGYVGSWRCAQFARYAARANGNLSERRKRRLQQSRSPTRGTIGRKIGQRALRSLRLTDRPNPIADVLVDLRVSFTSLVFLLDDSSQPASARMFSRLNLIIFPSLLSFSLPPSTIVLCVLLQVLC